MRNTILAVALLLVLAVVSGCATMGGGGSASADYTYVDTKVLRQYDAKLDDVYAAAVGVAEDMNWIVNSKTQNSDYASVRGENGDNLVTVTMEPADGGKTEVAIRYGFNGNRYWSEKIHEAIAAKL